MTGGETTRASSTLTDMFMKVILSFVVSFVVVVIVVDVDVDVCLFNTLRIDFTLYFVSDRIKKNGK